MLCTYRSRAQDVGLGVSAVREAVEAKVAKGGGSAVSADGGHNKVTRLDAPHVAGTSLGHEPVVDHGLVVSGTQQGRQLINLQVPERLGGQCVCEMCSIVFVGSCRFAFFLLTVCKY